MNQQVQYEGINLLCFTCGCIGHRKGNCPKFIREPTLSPIGGTPLDNASEPTNPSTPILGCQPVNTPPPPG